MSETKQIAGEERWGVLLLAHGAPDKLEEIPEFLRHVTGGRALPAAIVEEVRRRYSLIGGSSPLLSLTRQQAEALAARLARPVYVGMRNWKPFIAEAVRQVVADGIERMMAIPMAPQNSRTSVGLYRKRLDEAVSEFAPNLHVDFVESWHDQRSLIRAFAEQVREGLSRAEAAAGGRIPVIFTAHSVPEETILDGDPYDRQVRETMAAVANAAGCGVWRGGYQSQGMTRDRWLGPTVEAQIDELAREGFRHVFLAPIGFLTDHVEILYDIDILFREYARTRGVTLTRAESLNAHPLLIEALAQIALERRRQPTPAQS